MSYELKDRQMDGALRMYKEPTIPDEVKEYEPPVDLDALLDGITLSKLNDIFKEIMKRQHDKIDPVRSTFGKIEKEEITVEDKMEYLNTYILARCVIFHIHMCESYVKNTIAFKQLNLHQKKCWFF